MISDSRVKVANVDGIPPDNPGSPATPRIEIRVKAVNRDISAGSSPVKPFSSKLSVWTTLSFEHVMLEFPEIVCEYHKHSFSESFSQPVLLTHPFGPFVL